MSSFKKMFDNLRDREYPAGGRPLGVKGQKYELGAGIFVDGSERAIRRMRQELGDGFRITDGMRVLEIGCRQGDSTLGLFRGAAPARIEVIATDPVMEALVVARLKFGRGYLDHEILRVMAFCIGNHPTGEEAREWLDQMPRELFTARMREATKYGRDVEFLDPPDALGRYGPFSVGYGFQAGHWIETNTEGEFAGYPKAEHLQNIAGAIAPGGYVLLGYSTAFFEVDPEKQIDGMTMAQYSIDHHPFFEHYIGILVRNIAAATGKTEEDIVKGTVLHSKNPRPNESGYARYLDGMGLKLVSVMGYLVTPGAEQITGQEYPKLRPQHQGYMKFVPEPERARLLQTSLEEAHRTGAHFITPDATNISDAVPLVLFQKPG